MSLTLYGHLFSSYTWKALIAFYENETPFTFRGFGTEGRPFRVQMSRWFSEAKRMRTSTSPGPGSGSGTSS